ncbi:MAG TPA: hypothetical protein VM580_13985, partial [Labilithrix sp.]|nr:hypothetical protein [Labilithrix sp.]
MSPRSLRRILLASAFAATAVVGLPSTAHATINVFQETSLPRLDRDGKQINKRPNTLRPEGVNYQDCIDDQRIRFPLQLANFEGNASLQVWASLSGANCGDQQNRTGAQRTCWQLVTGVPLLVNPIVDIPVRRIMAGAPPNTPAVPVEDESVCGKVDLTQVSVQFLYFSPGQLATPSQTKALAVEIDTVGPPPPTGLRTQPGNGRIVVHWDNISGEGGVSVLTGVKVYCEVSGGASSVDAASTNTSPEASCVEVPNEPDADDDSGADAGTTLVCEDGGATDLGGGGGGTCSAPHLVEGAIPDATFNSQYECGALTGNAGTSVAATSIGGKPLTNNVTYAVAVAATDAFNNVGTLSAPSCEYPEETTDFWET